MKTFRLLPLALALAGLSACVTPQTAPPPGPPLTFAPEPFEWSAQSGSNSLQGSVGYAAGGATFTCAGSTVGLTPDAPYSRQRIGTLYGSIQRAALPVAEVRSRTVPEPGGGYSRFVRTARCDDQGRFSFTGLPDGGWFVIAQVRPAQGGGPESAMAVMQRVELRGGRSASIVLR